MYANPQKLTLGTEDGYWYARGLFSYQDTILLDMLLGIAINNFTPHQNHLGDGVGILLEILQALEKLHIESDATAATAATVAARPSIHS